jgi:rhodanese-related sulfurtransferase
MPSCRAWILGFVAVYALATAGCGARPESVQSLTAQEVMSMVDRPDAPLILDVRTSREYRSGHLPGAVNIEHYRVPTQLPALEPYKDRGVIVYCERGPRAYEAEQVLLDAGFEKVYHLVGDMATWRRTGFPVER